MESEKIELQNRGQLTERIKRKSYDLLGYSITTGELRLMAYLQYQLMNSQKLNVAKINSEEMDYLSNWVQKGYITDGVTENGRPMIGLGITLQITKRFWDAMSELLWLGYVELI